MCECTCKSLASLSFWVLRSRTHPRRSKQPKQNNFGAGVSEEVGRRIRCSLGGSKSRHDTFHDQYHQRSSRANWDISPCFLHFQTHLSNQSRSPTVQKCVRAKIQKMGVVEATQILGQTHLVHFFSAPH